MGDSIKLTWHGEAAMKAVLKNGNNRIVAAGIHLRNKIRSNISKPSKSKKGSKLGKAIAKERGEG